MALKAGLVGVNPDILDNSDRVTALSDGNKKLTFVYDEASDQPGFKINDGDFRPFEKAGVTCFGWVKPANVTRIGLVPYTNVDIKVGSGIFVDGDDVYVDMVLTPWGAAPAAGAAVVSGLPAADDTKKIFLHRTNIFNSADEALVSDELSVAAASTALSAVYVLGDKLYFTDALSYSKSVRVIGHYKKVAE